MLPLALAIVRHKQSIDKTVLLDNIDPGIIARLADLGIDYYAYSHYNLTTIIHIIKYFLVRGSTDHHSHITHALLNRIRPGEFTPYLQQFTLDCLSILQSTPHSAPKLSFSIKVQPHPSGPVLYKKHVQQHQLASALLPQSPHHHQLLPPASQNHPHRPQQPRHFTYLHELLLNK